MDFKVIIIFFINFTISINALRSRRLKHGPQVYENINEERSSQRHQKFNYAGATNNQIDLQRLRYHQQQQADANMLQRSNNSNMQKRETPAFYLVEAMPINYGLNYANNLRLLHESFGSPQEKDIEALNELVGKTPTVQLEGLKHLLNPKDYTPITEDIIDVANPQSKPNIKVEHAPPQYQQTVEQIQVLEDAQKKIKQQNLLDFNELEHKIALQQAGGIVDEAQAEAEDQYQGLLVDQAEKSIEKNNLQYASQYAFGYRVRDYHSGNDFGHEEISDGHTSKGHYHVLLPDGRLQNVQYWADETGFHAKVTYDKLAQH